MAPEHQTLSGTKHTQNLFALLPKNLYNFPHCFKRTFINFSQLLSFSRFFEGFFGKLEVLVKTIIFPFFFFKPLPFFFVFFPGRARRTETRDVGDAASPERGASRIVGVAQSGAGRGLGSPGGGGVYSTFL